MNMPPCLMRLKVVNEERSINLWLPLFLAWILLGVLAIILLPLLVIAVLVLWSFERGREVMRMGSLICCCVCGLRGLTVDVKNQREIVLIYFM